MRRRAAGMLVLLVLVACEPSRMLPSVERCTTEQFSLNPIVEGAPGSAVVGVEISHAGAPCVLETIVELRIVDEKGGLLEIQGNPGRTAITRALPADTSGVGWTWQNWCGEPIPIRYLFTAGAEKVVLEATAGPRCDEPAGGSRLAPLPA